MTAEPVPEKKENSLQASFAWWEHKRLLYNIVVGITGILVLLTIGIHDLSQLPGVILYGILANLFYSTGFLLEVATVHYLKKGMIFEKWRPVLFWTGLMFSVFVTAMIGFTIIFLTIFNF